MGQIGRTRPNHSQPKKVSAKQAQGIDTQIKALQDKRDELYEDERITDEQLAAQCVQLDKQINDLINSKY